jgi:cation transport regulator
LRCINARGAGGRFPKVNDRVETMPYASNSELPQAVRIHLPPHAQDIYRAAFNHAWDTYMVSELREEIAHRVAWSAVKKRYQKDGEFWVLRQRSMR